MLSKGAMSQRRRLYALCAIGAVVFAAGLLTLWPVLTFPVGRVLLIVGLAYCLWIAFVGGWRALREKGEAAD